MNRREQDAPGDSASAGWPGTNTAKALPEFADALQARLGTAGARVRQESSHLDQVAAVASEYLLAARPPRGCE